MMQVKDAMSKKVEFVGPETRLRECARKMRLLSIGVLPVRDNGKIIGFITDRDICCRAVGEVGDIRDPTTLTAKEIMTRTVASCFDDDDCTKAARLMKAKHLRRLAVMDHQQAMVGLLSVDDLARFYPTLAGEVLESAAPRAH